MRQISAGRLHSPACLLPPPSAFAAPRSCRALLSSLSSPTPAPRRRRCQDGLPTDVLRLVLRAVLGEERQDAYRLMRPLTTFMLVCKHWRQAALQTPLSINVDYMQVGTSGICGGRGVLLLMVHYAAARRRPNRTAPRCL